MEKICNFKYYIRISIEHFRCIYVALHCSSDYVGVLGAGDFMSLSNAAWSLSQQIRNVFHVLPKFHEYSLNIENMLVLDSYHSKLESSLDLPIDRQDSFQICVHLVLHDFISKIAYKR